MTILLISAAAALILMTGGCVIATMNGAPDPHSPAGRAAARERARAARRAQRNRNPRPWGPETPEQAN